MLEHDLGMLAPVKRNCNAVAHKGILDSCVLRTLWQEFEGKEDIDCLGVLQRKQD